MRRAIIAAALLAIAGCQDHSYRELRTDQWICTKETVVSFRPYLVQCVQFSMLR